MIKFKKHYNFKIILIALSISFLFTSILYSCPISEDSLRVPSSFQNPESRKRLDPKEVTKQRIRSAIRAARGNLSKASEIYYGKKKPSTFYGLAERYGQSGYAREVIKRNIRSAIRAARGNLTKASKEYYGKEKPSTFHSLVKQYSQLEYAKKVRSTRSAL